jgi:DNA-directed RNA polymerase subunit RPC12/RpoP
MIRKLHFFIDCDGFWHRDLAEERELHLVSQLQDITCGQCKGRILNEIRQRDWSKLASEEVAFLSRLAKQVKTEPL